MLSFGYQKLLELLCMSSKLTDRTTAAPEPRGERLELLERVAPGDVADVWRARSAEGAPDLALKVGVDREAAPVLAAEALHAALAPSPRLPELVDLGWHMYLHDLQNTPTSYANPQ